MQVLDTDSQTSSFEKPELIDWSRILDSGSKSTQKATNARPVENRPQDILDSWMVVEALSPEGYQQPEKLASELQGALMQFQISKDEPWLNDPLPKSKNKSVYYLAYLGAVRLDLASQALIDIYGDDPTESESREGFAALGLVVLNERGVPIPDTGLSLSSFGWAYSRALKTRLDDLKQWAIAEQRLREGLKAFIYRHDKDGHLIPLTLAALQGAYDWMIRNCAIPEEQLVRPAFAIRLERKLDNTPDTILNSFYLEDLERVKKAVLRGECGDALKRYLGVVTHKESIDLLNAPNSNQLVQDIVQPSFTPPGRWPAKGRHPLVLLQQAAVNLAFQELQDTGVFSVNGPPGTGKTTLLRDVVAGILVKRAEAMSAFDDPADAFTSVDNMETNYGHVHFYKPDSSLLGHEIIVASSNNNAVENVTKELPLKKAIAEDLGDFRYFKTLSDALSGSEDSTWGLIAAVLGNSANRNAFYSKGWMDSKAGLRAYLDSIIKPAKSDEEELDAPVIVAAEDAPENIEEAKQRWKKSKAEFKGALQRSRDMAEKVQGAYEAQRHIDQLTPLLSQSEQQEQEKSDAYDRAKAIYQYAIKQRDDLQESLGSERERERIFNQTKPGWISRLFKWAEWKKWTANSRAILEALLECQSRYSDALKNMKTHEVHCQLAEQDHVKAQRETKNIALKIQGYTQKVELANQYCGGHLISDTFSTLR